MRKLKKMVVGFVAILGLCLVPANMAKAASGASNTKEGAGIINADTMYSDSITVQGKSDYYKIQAVNSTSYYQFTYTTDSNATGGFGYNITDDNGKLIDSQYVYKGEGKSAKVKLAPGAVYYLEVTSNYDTGAYNFSYHVYSDVADTKAAAQTVKSGTKYSETVSTKDDVDYYKIQAVNYTNYYQFTYTTDSNATGGFGYNITDDNGKLIDSQYVYKGEGKSAKVKLTPGAVYYLEVKSDNGYTGAYSFSFNVFSDVADTKAEAKSISLGSTTKDSIATEADEDWYTFYSDKEQNLKADFVGEGVGINAYLFDEAGNQIWSTVAYSEGQTKNNVIQKGKYYLKVNCAYDYSNRSDAYNFTLTASPIRRELKQDSWGDWYYYVNGQIDRSKTGIVYDDKVGWWYVENGEIDFDFNDLYYDNNYGWWLISGGSVNFGYSGLYGSSTYGWWLINGGTVNFDYSGLYGDANYGWWLVNGGAVNFGYNGLYGDANYGWWLVNGGAVNFGYNGLYGDANYGWWLVNGGSVNFGYNGLYGDANVGWWLVNGGAVNFAYTDLYCDANVGWWKVNGGAVDFGYNGWYNSPAFGWWNINGGAVMF